MERQTEGLLNLYPAPLGVSDPLWEFELAESLHMSVSEIRHGRGTPMSAWEMCVGWPEYFASKGRAQDREEQRHEGRGRRV